MARLCTIVYRSDNVFCFHPVENRLDDMADIYELVDFAIACEHNAVTRYVVNLGDYDQPEQIIPPA